MKKRAFLLTVVLAALVMFPALAQASPEVTPLPRLGIHSIDTMRPNGEYVIFVLTGTRWQEVGTLSFDRFFRERELDLGPYLSSSGQKAVRVRLVQRGGGAAHIDSVFLGGLMPTEVKVKGYNARFALKKVSQTDYDVLDAFQKNCEVVFPSQGHDAVLRITARVEGTEISTTPFQFPRENLYREMTSGSRFYPYTLSSGAGAQEPFFKEYSRTGSGHPSGYTYGWVKNDEKNLYVTIDFTPDNTMDGDKDYAMVYAKTSQGLKEFRVSVPERRWGRARFTYTDTVAYQHKVYEFTIPLHELGVKDVGKEKDLLLAFSAYGTAGPGDHQPSLAYDPENNRFLVVYFKVDGSGTVYDIYGQLLSPDGTAVGPEFAVSNAVNNQQYPSVAYDSVNQRFLVVLQDFRNGSDTDIYGQLVNADGSLYGAGITSGVNFTISNAVGYQYNPSVAYDSVNQRFLVAWMDYRSGSSYDIYGQMVNADGSLYGAGITSGVNFTVSNALNYQYYPSVAYDSVNQRFLVAWQDERNGNNDIYGQLVNADGSLYGAGITSGVNFTISNALNAQYAPSVAYDSVNQRYLVAWYDYRSGAWDIYGQVVNADGSLYGAGITSGVNFTISNALGYQQSPSMAYDSVNQRFLVVWQDERNGPSDIYGQVVNADGSLYGVGITSGVNFTISATSSNKFDPAVAYNPLCSSFLVAYQDWAAAPPDIAFSRVGNACETTPPTVASTAPANNATGVAIATNVTATFSEAMRASTINTTTFTLSDGTNAVSGTVGYDSGTQTATFTPTSALSYSTIYTATITTGVTDLVGNALAADYTWSFTTVSAGGGGNGGCGCVTASLPNSNLEPLGTLILCGVVTGLARFMRRKRA